MEGTIRIIGVPMDLGQSQRGVDMGPSAIRYAGLSRRLRDLGYRVQDQGNVHVPVRDTLKSTTLVPAIVQACEAVYEVGKRAVESQAMPIFLGGDHSIAIGTIGGVSHREPVGVLWIDAHGDFNTYKTSKSGNVHGMALAVLTGRGATELVNIGRRGPTLRAKDVVLVGVRDLDPEEKKALKESGIAVYTMRDIDEQGISTVIKKALNRLRQLSRIHVSLDMDSLDPSEAPGVGTPVAGGLNYREAHLIMETVADTRRLASMDIVEINPILDQGNTTAKTAIELAVSAWGKRIL
ncbi:MAG: arginase [Deltaproteobacteria bacterium]|nr:arginase [Deltaproteobacteria bacterium]